MTNYSEYTLTPSRAKNKNERYMIGFGESKSA